MENHQYLDISHILLNNGWGFLKGTRKKISLGKNESISKLVEWMKAVLGGKFILSAYIRKVSNQLFKLPPHKNRKKSELNPSIQNKDKKKN